MAVASNPLAAYETLKTLHWCTNVFKSKTNLGLSNVSFGMPGRPWLNATFLAMAQFCGLTIAIANPASSEIMNVKKAGDVLMAKDKDALRFIEHFSVSNCHWFRNYNESFITSREKNYRRNKLTATEMISYLW